MCDECGIWGRVCVMAYLAVGSGARIEWRRTVSCITGADWMVVAMQLHAN